MYTFTLLLLVTFVSYAMYATITATLEFYIRPMFFSTRIHQSVLLYFAHAVIGDANSDPRGRFASGLLHICLGVRGLGRYPAWACRSDGSALDKLVEGGNTPLLTGDPTFAIALIPLRKVGRARAPEVRLGNEGLDGSNGGLTDGGYLVSESLQKSRLGVRVDES